MTHTKHTNIIFTCTASQMSKNYYSARMQGVPFPILNVAEYFSIDGECYRWGRTYQLAGFYTHALLW